MAVPGSDSGVDEGAWGGLHRQLEIGELGTDGDLRVEEEQSSEKLRRRRPRPIHVARADCSCRCWRQGGAAPRGGVARLQPGALSCPGGAVFSPSRAGARDKTAT